jgi:hypothetical protein
MPGIRRVIRAESALSWLGGVIGKKRSPTVYPREIRAVRYDKEFVDTPTLSGQAINAPRVRGADPYRITLPREGP